MADSDQGGRHQGSSDEIPVFVAGPSANDRIPQWLAVARPEWYRTEDGPVLHIIGDHELLVRSAGESWVVRFDGVDQIARSFEDLLQTLAGLGPVLVETFPKGAEEGHPKVRTGLDPGFAADLMWWSPEGVYPSINGIVFHDWWEAPAPYRDSDSGVWEVLDELHWEMDEGHSMTGSYGTLTAYRIGARFVGDTGDDSTLGAYTGPQVAREFFREYTSDDDWERYGLDEGYDPDDDE